MQLIIRFWKTLGVLTLIIGVIFLPKNLQGLGEAAEPWRRMWSIVDQNTALWIVAITMGGWIIWTDVRPYWREWLRERYPPRHAAILQDLAAPLATAESAAATRINALMRSDAAMTGLQERFYEATAKIERLVSEIPYDTSTAKTIRDYVHLCAMILHDEIAGNDTRENRALLQKMRVPVFKALHSGKSINREAVPLADWMTA